MNDQIKKQLKENRDFYVSHIKNVLLPYWLNRCVDEEYGGYFTAFTPDGKELRNTNKYTWSQGRVGWSFSRLAGTKSDIFSEGERAHMLALAKTGCDFALSHSVTPEQTCHLVVDRCGVPLEAGPGLGTIGNTFADSFISMSLAAYAETASAPEMLEKAFTLYKSIEERTERGAFSVVPNPVPPGFEMLSIYMIMVNLTNELHRALSFFGDSRAIEVEKAGKRYCEHVLTHFAQPEGVLLEQVRTDGGPADNLLGRYLCPGHSVETMWFTAVSCARRGETQNEKKALDLLWNTYQLAKDTEYGGLYYFLDKAGGKPTGQLTYPEDHKMAALYEQDWTIKLWWSHTETLFGLLLGYIRTGETKWFDEYQVLHEYIFRTFPNPNLEVGEWLMLRDRYGNPIESAVGAVPLKCPYHTFRNLLMSIELLDQCTES